MRVASAPVVAVVDPIAVAVAVRQATSAMPWIELVGIAGAAVTCIAHAVPVGVSLGLVGHPLAVVDAIRDAVIIPVLCQLAATADPWLEPIRVGRAMVTHVASEVLVPVHLVGIGDIRAVVIAVHDPIVILVVVSNTTTADSGPGLVGVASAAIA